MSIITRYILKEHLGPFLYSVTTIIFIFLLNVAFRDLGRILGKGLAIGVVLEFFGLNLAWILMLAVPMSVLVATLMAFGRLSADNEIAALKASGVHFYRLLIPVLVITFFVFIGLERFGNSVLPDFNHRFRLLYTDVSRKRPTLTLEPNVFFDEIPKYTLLVHGVEDEGKRLNGVIIDDHSDPQRNKTIIAERGNLHFSYEQERMVFTLYDGEVHEVEINDLRNYRRLRFEKQVIYIPVPDLVLKRSESKYRGDREKTAAMMQEDIRKNRSEMAVRQEAIRKLVARELSVLFPEAVWESVDDQAIEARLNERPLRWNGRARMERLVRQIQGERKIIQNYRRSINALMVEWHKKYSIPFACIVFALIGAPLGIMARQGGLAIGAGMGLAFFLIYWAFLIAGEQLADRMLMSPLAAMWMPNLILGIGGAVLVYRTVRETTFIPWERWAHWFQRRSKQDAIQ